MKLQAKIMASKAWKNNIGEDMLDFTVPGGTAGTFNAKTATLTLSGPSSSGRYQTEIEGVTCEISKNTVKCITDSAAACNTTDVSSASRPSLPDVASTGLLILMLAKMAGNGVSAALGMGERWWQGKGLVEVGEHKAVTSSDVQTKIDSLKEELNKAIALNELDKSEEFVLYDLLDDIEDAQAKGAIDLATCEDWEKDFDDTKKEFALASPSAMKLNAFFQPSIASVEPKPAVQQQTPYRQIKF